MNYFEVLELSTKQTVLVFDLGDTFDVTIMKINAYQNQWQGDQTVGSQSR